MNLPTKLLPKLLTISLFLSPIALPALSLLTQASPVMAQNREGQIQGLKEQLADAQERLRIKKLELTGTNEALADYTARFSKANNILRACEKRNKGGCEQAAVNSQIAESKMNNTRLAVNTLKGKITTLNQLIERLKTQIVKLLRK